MKNLLWILCGAVTVGLLMWIVLTGKLALLWVPFLTLLPWLSRVFRVVGWYRMARSIWGRKPSADGEDSWNKDGAWWKNKEQGNRNGRHSDMTPAEAAQILDIPISATRQQIKRAWQQKIVLHHPDQGGDPEKAARINRARDVMLESL